MKAETGQASGVDGTHLCWGAVSDAVLTVACESRAAEAPFIPLSSEEIQALRGQVATPRPDCRAQPSPPLPGPQAGLGGPPKSTLQSVSQWQVLPS